VAGTGKLFKETQVQFRRSWRLVFLLAIAEIAPSQDAARLQLVGAGSTAPLPVYSTWFQSFEKSHPDLHLSYMPFGSDAGIKMATSGAADFGCSDAPLTDGQLAQAKLSQFSTFLIAIVPVYSLPGITEPIKFSPKALAGIYLGTITRWNDPAISDANPGVQLPASDIVVIHSANGRGSTFIWSDYLTKVSVEWRSRVGRGVYVKWPVGTAAEGNGNLAKMVAETPNSIGNVELAFALHTRLQVGQVQNSAGNFITADSTSMTAAAKAMPSDSRNSLTNPPGRGSYPLSSFTWILIPENMNSTKREAMKEFLRWMLNEGQISADMPGFARLPPATVEPEMRAVERIP
jgi:phosphate transport system substrate-binding protein